jgi:hypothetical protein
MNGASMSSNVYYLPARTEIVDAYPVPRRPSWWMRVTLTWWRARVTAREVCTVLRRGGRRWLTDVDALVLARTGDERPRQRYAVPARVIDFAAARQRLRA